MKNDVQRNQFSFRLSDADTLKLEAVRECGYTLNQIVREGVDVCPRQTREEDGEHLTNRRRQVMTETIFYVRSMEKPINNPVKVSTELESDFAKLFLYSEEEIDL